MVALMWIAVRRAPARVGIVLMSGVLIGAASAALIAREHLSAPQITRDAFMLDAGVLEVWPEKRSG